MIEDELNLLKLLRQKTGPAHFKSETEIKIGEKIAKVIKELDAISEKNLLFENILPKTEKQEPVDVRKSEEIEPSGFC